jgi:DNA polymerase III epsilon subunit-like protein
MLKPLGLRAPGSSCRVVSLAWVVASDSKTCHEFKACIVKPDGYFIPERVAAIHGITTDRAHREGIPLVYALLDLARDIRTWKPRSIVAHNAAFDLPVIRAEFERVNVEDPTRFMRTQCTMLASRQKWPGESARLCDVYARSFRSRLHNSHTAQTDVWGCYQIFFHLGMNAS